MADRVWKSLLAYNLLRRKEKSMTPFRLGLLFAGRVVKNSVSIRAKTPLGTKKFWYSKQLTRNPHTFHVC